MHTYKTNIYYSANFSTTETEGDSEIIIISKVFKNLIMAAPFT